MIDLRFALTVALGIGAGAGGLTAQASDVDPPEIRPLPSLQDQAVQRQQWVEARLDRVLPALMRERNVSMWILSMREYAEDPVFWSITSPTSFAARRRSIYVFYDRGPTDGVERIALGGGSQGGLYESYRSSTQAPDAQAAELWGGEQWRLLQEIVRDRDPANIVLNIDEHQAFSDGLHAGERVALERALGSFRSRIRHEPGLALDYIAIRVPEMLPRYEEIQETVHALIGTAFSSRVIEPGRTTTGDVRWWLRQRVQELGMTVWFHPSVSFDRPGDGQGFAEGVIQEGDVLWVDFGVVAMGLKTDTQHLGYVLRTGEAEAPDGVQECLRTSNRLQDILLAEMEPGLSGNAILANALDQMRSEGIDGTIYTHPIGDHGHGAGPLIGRWDNQEGLPNRGEVLLRASTWHSIELQATVAVPEWNRERLSCRQEEEAQVTAEGERRWLLKRQTDLHLVR